MKICYKISNYLLNIFILFNYILSLNFSNKKSKGKDSESHEFIFIVLFFHFYHKITREGVGDNERRGLQRRQSTTEAQKKFEYINILNYGHLYRYIHTLILINKNLDIYILKIYIRIKIYKTIPFCGSRTLPEFRRGSRTSCRSTQPREKKKIKIKRRGESSQILYFLSSVKSIRTF